MTPLHWAVKLGLWNIAYALIDKGADKNAQNIDRNTPLHLATMLENDSILLGLLENNVDETISNKWNKTPLGILNGKRTVQENKRPRDIPRLNNIHQMSVRLGWEPSDIDRSIKPVEDNNLILSEVFKTDGECSICGESFDTDVCVTGDCKHVFHCRCINAWFAKGNNKCALCIQEVTRLIKLNDKQIQELNVGNINSFGNNNKLSKLVSIKRYLRSLG